MCLGKKSQMQAQIIFSGADATSCEDFIRNQYIQSIYRKTLRVGAALTSKQIVKRMHYHTFPA